MGALALLLPFASELLDKFFPDPQARAAAQLELARMAQTGELAQLNAATDIARAQIAVNTAEAARAGREFITWREAFGWTIVAAVAFKLIGGPLLKMLCDAAGHPIELPALDISELWPVLIGMLGLGSLKTIETVKANK